MIKAHFSFLIINDSSVSILNAFDYNVVPLLGEFGIYQNYLIVMLMSSCFFIAFIYLAQAFLVVVPTEFWCKLPQVKDLTAEQLRDFMIPSAKMVPYEGHHLAYSRCWVYDIAVEKAIAARQPDANWPVKKCNEWEFKLSASDVPYISVAAEQKWVIIKLILNYRAVFH